ncbi:MAG TPA: CidA/LrgA family protein [Pseudomonadales bacterium]|nr:CidA/LrgA family protein [Gammaproteobacteria bacterium]HUH57492.1 CidA/LrgA family protein [Pseudomonadales bacterium]
MLLRGLSLLVAFQLVGTAFNVLFFPVIPGPIIGLVLLFIYLMLRGRVDAPLNEAAGSLLRYLPLLLVPPAIGVMAHVADIQADFWAIVGALVISLLVSMVFLGWLMQALITRQARNKDKL